MDLQAVFQTPKPVIGMLHVPPLPGSPANTLTLGEIQGWVLRDAQALADGGLDGLMLENFGDTPFYPDTVPPHTVAFLSVLGYALRRQVPLPLGVNVLRNDSLSALAVAAAIDAQYIRVNVHTGARLSDQGILQGRAHRLLRYRRALSSSVAIFADVAVKHSAPLAPRSLVEEIEDTVARGLADAVILTGAATGKPARLAELRQAQAAAGETPVFVGSGVTAANAAQVLALASGLIVGSALKQAGDARQPVDPARLRRFMDAVRRARP